MDIEIKKKKVVDIITQAGNKKNRLIFQIQKINANIILHSPILNSFYQLNSINNRKLIINNFDLNGLLELVIEKQKPKCLSRNLFHKQFLAFIDKLEFKNITRKINIDCVLKKCKAKFYKAFKSLLRKLLNKRKNMFKLPREFVNDIRINNNKKYLNFTMIQIYEEYGVQIDLNKIKNNIDNKKYEILIKLLNYTYKNLFTEYINSKRFVKDCNSICVKEGKKYELLFRYVSKFFIYYYKISLGNKFKI